MDDIGHNDVVQQYVAAFATSGSDVYIRNLQTSVTLHRWGDALLPMTVNDGAPASTFVCSPWVGYVDYTKEELTRFPNPALAPVLTAVVDGVAQLLKYADVNRIVHINNWMTSTCLVLDLDVDLVTAQTRDLVARFPDHFLAIRSLTKRHQPGLMAALDREGWILLPSRQIFIVDDINTQLNRRRDLKRDDALWRESHFSCEAPETMSRTDAERMAQLYALLYLEKYSWLNPVYTPDFIVMSHDIGLIRYLVCRDADGVIQSFGGMHHLGRHGTMPLLGYNTALDQSLGLYRLAFHAGTRYAAQHRLKFNMSSGAAGFKMSRGATAEIEYTAFYLRHLPFGRRFPVRLLGAVAHWVGVPLLKRYRL